MQTPQSHPPSTLLQPSRPTIATQSSETNAFSSAGLDGVSVPAPSVSPQAGSTDPVRQQLVNVLPTFSKYGPLRGTVRIRVEDATFYCHREVLALASPFFASVLGGGWRETQASSSAVHTARERCSGDATPLVRESDRLSLAPDPPTCLPDEPYAGATLAASTGSLRSSHDAGSIYTTVTCSSIVEDSDADDDPLDATFVECRLRIHEESASSFQDLLCHVYPRLECAIHWSNVEDLCRMGLKFDIPSLTNACLAFLLPSAAGRPALCMKIAEEFGIPTLYREGSRYLLDNYGGWTSEELAILDPMTLLKLERKRSWFLERLLKLGQIQMLRDYACHPACDDQSRCARLVDEKWRSAFSSAFRFGTPQPSIIYRSLRSLEPSLSSPALHLPFTACQTHAKLYVADLFDRMFGLGIQPARNWSTLALNGTSASASPGSGNWASLRAGAGDTVHSQKNNSARYFLCVELRDESLTAGGNAQERARDLNRSAAA